jgi:uncharacterized membrane protein YgdD (TMEM256/DUF423 family)
VGAFSRFSEQTDMSMWWKVGAMMGMTAVMTGSFGSHGLRGKVEPRDLEIWETACKYQFYHSLAILLAVTRAGAGAKLPCALFTAGVSIFSGSLYTLVLTGNRKWGAVTPIGGVSLIAGWFSLLFI